MARGVRVEVDIDKVVALYLSGMSAKEVSEAVSVSRSTITARLKEQGVLRTPAEGVKNAYRNQATKRIAHNRADLTGRKFSRLKVDSRAGTSKHQKSLWNCTCDCGNHVVVDTSTLTQGNTKSCGCLRTDELQRRGFRKDIGTKTYRIWQAMLNRCRNKNVPHYCNYGGRGITVCDRWANYENFVSDMGKCPEGDMSIDRIDNDGNYEPGNCRWATRKEQNRNKRGNRLITYDGETMILKEWAERLDIDQASLRERLEKWDLSRALTQPKKGAA